LKSPTKSPRIAFISGIISNDHYLSTESAEIWRNILNVNVVAASLCAQLSINSMLDNGKKKHTFDYYHVSL
jgi:hypothetical protein